MLKIPSDKENLQNPGKINKLSEIALLEYSLTLQLAQTLSNVQYA